MKTNRRRFLEQTAQAALSAGPLAAASYGSEHGASAQMPIVDTHQHLWDLSKFHLPWLKSAKHINRSYLTKDYLQAAEGLGVVKTVYMEVAVDPSQQLAEAQHVVELCLRLASDC